MKPGLPGTAEQPRLWRTKHPNNGEPSDQSKAVRCESTALHGVCQARTTISSSLYAYPPPLRSKAEQTAVENAGRPVWARVLALGRLAFVQDQVAAYFQPSLRD